MTGTNSLFTLVEALLRFSKAKEVKCLYWGKKQTCVLVVVSPSQQTLEDTSPAGLGREAACKRPVIPVHPGSVSSSSRPAQPKGAR